MADLESPIPEKEKSRRPRFSNEEDAIIIANYRDKETDWNYIASLCNGRTSKQVYDRYKTYLDPNINKEPWTDEEFKTLTLICNTTGTNWKYIRKFFPGRTIYNIKNAFQILCNHGTLNKAKCQSLPKQLDDHMLNALLKQPGNTLPNIQLSLPQQIPSEPATLEPVQQDQILEKSASEKNCEDKNGIYITLDPIYNANIVSPEANQDSNDP